MAGFALHLRLFHEHSTFVFNVSAVSIARQESQLLDTMTTMDKLECLANNASKVKKKKERKNSRNQLGFRLRSTFGTRKLSRCT